MAGYEYVQVPRSQHQVALIVMSLFFLHRKCVAMNNWSSTIPSFWPKELPLTETMRWLTSWGRMDASLLMPTSRTFWNFTSKYSNTLCRFLKTLMYLINPPDLLLGNGLWEQCSHGRHVGKRRHLSHHGREAVEPRGRDQHLIPDVQLWHGYLLWPVCFQGKITYVSVSVGVQSLSSP